MAMQKLSPYQLPHKYSYFEEYIFSIKSSGICVAVGVQSPVRTSVT